MRSFLLIILVVVLNGCGKVKPPKQCSNASCALTSAETIDDALSKAISKYSESNEEDSQESLTDLRCRVFAQIHDFDILPLFSPCNEMDRERVFSVMVDEFKKIGDVNVTEAKPLFESLFSDPPKDVSAILSIGNDFQFQAKLIFSSTVKMILNGCETSCPIWEHVSYAHAASQNLTEQACQVVEDAVKQFAHAYGQANPHARPVFKIRNVMTLL